MMAVCPLMSPDDAEDAEVNPVVLRRIVDRLTQRDGALLERLERERRIDVDTLETDGYSASDLIWGAHYALYGVEVDPADRVFLTRKKEGRIALDALRGTAPPPRKRKGRRPVALRL